MRRRVYSYSAEAYSVTDSIHGFGLMVQVKAGRMASCRVKKQGSKGGCVAIPNVRGQCDGVQEPSIVQVQELPQSLNLIWPDLDLDSYSTGTSAANPVDPHRSQTQAS